MHFGVRYNFDESIIRLLLEHKANPNATDKVTRGEGEGVGHGVARVYGGDCGVRSGLV